MKKQHRTYPNLASYLEGTGLTQVELARKLGVSQPIISKLVRGLCQPSLHEALRISRLTGVPVESLVTRGADIPVEKS